MEQLLELKTEVPQNFKQLSENIKKKKKKKLSKMLLGKFKMPGNWKRQDLKVRSVL